jgi:acetyl-CoA decarbonylase/synthase complex subunit delta
MAFAIPKIDYTGKIKPITLGKGPKAVNLGQEDTYPFHLFEGTMPNLPKIAIEVYDIAPDEWAEAALEPYKDVVNDPVAWAKKAINEYGADMICLQLASTDPNSQDATPAQAAETTKKVASAIDVPVIVYGSANQEKDAEVLRKVAEECEGLNLILGPVQDLNYKQIGAGAIAYQHTASANTPIDINLAKQLNILLGNLGVQDDKLIIDPTTGGLGYGIEYSYSVVERIRIAALSQGDDRLQFPMICNLAKEVWKTKEAKTGDTDLMGKGSKRGIIMEAITAMLLVLAGADILIMRHPDAIKVVREMISDLTA